MTNQALHEMSITRRIPARMRNKALAVSVLTTVALHGVSIGAATAARVDADMQAGNDAGVNGTPAFFINGRLLSGAQPYDEFKKVIDEELARR